MTRDQDSGRPSGRFTAALLLAAGVGCLLGALAVAGGVATLLLAARGSDPGGDCVGAEVVPALLLAGSAVAGLVGVVLAAAGGVVFWHSAGAVLGPARPEADGS